MRLIKFYLTIISLLAVAYSCDVLQTDSLPEPDSASSVKLVALSGGAVVFDLAEIIKPTSDATTRVTASPTSGKLESLGGQLFRYVPELASEGTDRAIFKTTFSGSQVQRLDTVSFDVKAPQNASDSLELPCTIITSDDYYTIRSDEPVQVNLLGNDYICPAISLDNPPVTILKQPVLGTISLNEEGFTYTRSAGVEAAVDTVIYKVCGQAEERVCNIGIAYLIHGGAGSPCHWELGDDYAEFGATSTSSQLSVYVFVNDTICDLSKIKSFDISKQPEFGSAAIASVDSGRVVYELLDPDFTGEDEFTYTVCSTDNQCFSANVTIGRFDCVLRAEDDYFYVIDSIHSAPDMAIMEILFNDQLCGEDLQPVITELPQHGTATIDNNNYLVYSDFSELQHLDSLKYQLCSGPDHCEEASVVIERIN